MHKLPNTARTRRRVLGVIIVMNVVATPVFAQPASSSARPPRPAAIWPSGPLEVIVAFESPAGPATAKAFAGKSIAYFDPARPSGTRSSTAPPSGSVRIVGARLDDAGRTLTLATDPHSRLAEYLLPTPDGAGDPASTGSQVPNPRYDLSGLEATWTPDTGPDAQPSWSGWWPALDLETTRRLTRGSKRHEDGLALLAKPGRLNLSTLVRLSAGALTVEIESSQPFDEVIFGESQAEFTAPAPPRDLHRATLKVQSQGDPVFLSITCRTGANQRPLSLTARHRAGDAKSDHAFERGQTMLPWTPAPATSTAPVVVPDLTGGDPARGKILFSGEQARCSQCHAIRGQGGAVGPDLTEIGKKDRAEIYRAIAAPSAAIEPEFLTYSVATKSGQVVVGIVRAEGPDAIRVSDTNAHATVIPRAEIEQIRPSANSIMPVGLTGTLGDAGVRDLIAFLTDRSATTPRAAK